MLFSRTGTGCKRTAFPPFVLIRQVLNKLVSSKGTYLTLVAPYWPQKELFPVLQSLSVAPPVALPMCRDLLRQPHFHRLHRDLLVLNLHAWRLLSGLLDT